MSRERIKALLDEMGELLYRYFTLTKEFHEEAAKISKEQIQVLEEISSLLADVLYDKLYKRGIDIGYINAFLSGIIIENPVMGDLTQRRFMEKLTEEQG